jgi:hypothetical protein
MNTVIDEAMGQKTAEELQWETEEDVRALVKARRIMADPDRLERAETYLRQGLEQVES